MSKISRPNATRVMLSCLYSVFTRSQVQQPPRTSGRPAAPYQPPPPPPPVFSWTGCYVGANVGGGWASKSSNDVAGAVTGVIGADLGSHTASGVIGGGQIGCDYQAGVWVFGVQGMFGGSGMQGSNPIPSLVRHEFSSSWLVGNRTRRRRRGAHGAGLCQRGRSVGARRLYPHCHLGGTIANASTINRDGPPVAALSGPSREIGPHLPNTTTLTSERQA